jgi:hypothetical protein
MYRPEISYAEIIMATPITPAIFRPLVIGPIMSTTLAPKSYSFDLTLILALFPLLRLAQGEDAGPAAASQVLRPVSSGRNCCRPIFGGLYPTFGLIGSRAATASYIVHVDFGLVNSSR